MSWIPKHSPEERRTWLATGMRTLRKEPLADSHGGLLYCMMEGKSKLSVELVCFARRWIDQYPDNEHSPELVGRWLEVTYSEEAKKLAAHYLRSAKRTDNLWPIVRAVVHSPTRCTKLEKSMALRLEEDPGSYAWTRLEPQAVRRTTIDKLVLRWLELNRHNRDLGIYFASTALFTDSLPVLESILAWAQTTGADAMHVAFVWSHLLRGRSDAHRSMRELVAAGARAWVGQYPLDEGCGTVYGRLIRNGGDSSDAEAGLRWYKKHKSNRTSWSVLDGLLCRASRDRLPPDSYVVQQAKLVLQKLPTDQRLPVLIGSLVEASPDDETIAMARDLYQRTRLHWLLAVLIRVAPDTELLAKGQELLLLRTDSDSQSDVLVALLEHGSITEDTLKSAKRWLRRNPVHAKRDCVKSLLRVNASC